MPVADSESRSRPLPPSDAFHFGRNWQRYVSTYLDPERERIAGESLLGLVGDLGGKTFLDIGCGSGLFSLCAHRTGAGKVISLDVDPDAVAATRRLHFAAGAPESWTIMHRSILEEGLLAELEPADVVYSWGVLHHTGDMYTAIRNAAALVTPGGRFVIAIYNRVTGRFLDSARWWHIKRTYNRVPRAGQIAMELGYSLYWLAGRLHHRQNPLRVAHDYRHSRGMALRTDWVDWLGGYPYEYATAAEIVRFCEDACGLAVALVRCLEDRDWGNNEFVFERPT